MATKQVKGGTQSNVSTVFTLIRRSTLPQTGAGRGMVAKPPAIAIRPNGQIAANTKATEALEAKAAKNGKQISKLIFGFDAKSRTLQIRALTGTPKLEGAYEGWTEEDFFPVGRGKKTKSVYCGVAGLLQDLGYDYKASGVQSFPCLTVADGELTINLPKGALTPPAPKATTKKAEKPVAAKPAPVADEDEEDGDLELSESEDDENESEDEE